MMDSDHEQAEKKKRKRKKGTYHLSYNSSTYDKADRFKSLLQK